MANLKGPTYIHGAREQMGFYHYAGSTDTGPYIHIKINLPKQTSEMSCIEAVGYNFGTSSAIRCQWSFYNYGGSTTILNIGLNNIYNGLQAHGVYYSADGYCVIRAYATSLYYACFTLNAHQVAGNGIGRRHTVLAVAQNSNSGAHY